MNVAIGHSETGHRAATSRQRANGWRRLWRLRHPLFFVALPTLLAALYYGVVAAPLYVSESRFVVRYTAPPSANGFSSFLQSAGITRSQDDTFLVRDFLQSRDALVQLGEGLDMRAIFTRPEADLISRFPQPWDSASFEALFRYFGKRVKVTHNSTTGITTLLVTAFRPDDAYAVNRALLASGSELLNRLNERARADAIRFSLSELQASERRLVEAQLAITDFRNRELMVDPARSSSAMLDLIGRLAAELTTSRAKLAETRSAAPDSTALPFMTSRIEALEQQIEAERAKLVGNDASIAPRIATYERLVLERELASKMLTSATTALDTSRADARRQQLYLELVVAPGKPDEPELPYRLLSVIVVFVSSAIAFAIGWLTLAAARDYLNS